MSTDIEFSKVQIPKIIQSAGSIGSWLGNLVKKALTNITISWARDNLPGLVSNLTLNAIKTVWYKNKWKSCQSSVILVKLCS